MVGQRLVNARRDAVELYVRDKADVVRRIEFNENKYQQEIEEKRKIGIEFVMTQVSTRTLGGPSLFLEFTHTHTLTLALSLYHTYPLPLSSSSSSLFFLLYFPSHSPSSLPLLICRWTMVLSQRHGESDYSIALT